MFIDKTAATIAMARRSGRGPESLENHDRHRKPARQRYHCALAARRSDERPAFCTYLEAVLVPDLTPGDAVVLDNLPAHKVSGIRERIEAAGARLLYLLPYSPKPRDRTATSTRSSKPSKLKALLRTEATRTIPDLWAAAKRLLTHFNPTKCRTYLAAAGYYAN